MTEAGILIEVKNDNDREAAYQPGRGVEILTVKYVVDALEKRGNIDIPVVESSELNRLRDCLSSFSETIEKSPANALLKNI